MRFLFFLLILVSVILILNISHQAEAKILPNGAYLIQGNGFVISKDIIENSKVDFQFSTSKVGNSVKLNLKDGILSISNSDYIATTGWTGNTIFDGKFFRLSGNVESSEGIEFPVSFFGRLVEESDEGIIYSVTGQLKSETADLKLVYIIKIVGSPIIHTEDEKPSEEKLVQISILSGSSDPGNIKYYSADTVTITPGTKIVWNNDDSVSHTIMSGIASFSPGKPFKPDFKINSGDIAPGQTFSVTINDLGITRFFDLKYDWMDGVIITLPEQKSVSIGKNTETAVDIKTKYLSK